MQRMQIAFLASAPPQKSQRITAKTTSKTLLRWTPKHHLIWSLRSPPYLLTAFAKHNSARLALVTMQTQRHQTRLQAPAKQLQNQTQDLSHTTPNKHPQRLKKHQRAASNQCKGCKKNAKRNTPAGVQAVRLGVIRMSLTSRVKTHGMNLNQDTYVALNHQ